MWFIFWSFNGCFLHYSELNYSKNLLSSTQRVNVQKDWEIEQLKRDLEYAQAHVTESSSIDYYK